MDILEYISTWSVLKWVILVLIAGFIGQFGRMMAEAVIARVRRRRAKQREAREIAGKVQTPESHPIETALAESLSQPAESVQILDKKALKAIVKARKKETKKK